MLFSCSSDDETIAINELQGLTKFKEISNNTHTIELYSQNGFLEQGYNAISLRIKNNTTNNYITNASVEWMPLMHMMMMTHSCPKSTIEKKSSESSLYVGYIIFQMAQNETEYWDLKIDYNIDGTPFSVTTNIDVPASVKKRVASFTGTDNVKYVVAYIEPYQPKVALNNMTVGIFKMENMMSFPIVNDLKLKIDPRMPSMGNHGSPNNVDLEQSLSNTFYNGKLSLTMTGYWKINLQLLNASNEILKGETITETNESSSLFFEIEF